jgi:transcriptional regulator with XRE-family HTH domain
MRKALGVHIRHLREKQGISQTELARAVNIHRIYLGDIEHGRSNVTLEILVRIAHHLQTELADLFQGPPV